MASPVVQRPACSEAMAWMSTSAPARKEGGRVCAEHHGELVGRDGHVVIGAGAGAVVPLVIAASELSVADVDTDVPGSALHDRLAPMDREGDIADGPALTLQATRFACGSIAPGMRMPHALSDGVGAAELATTVPCPWTLPCRSRMPLARRW